MLTLPESARWLTGKGRHDEAWESLKWIRASDSAETWKEMEEIRLGVKENERAQEGFQMKGERSDHALSLFRHIPNSPIPRAV